MQQHDWPYYAFAGACFALAIAIRIRQFGRTQRLRLGTLWIVPAIFLMLAATIFTAFPPSGLGWLWIGLGLIAGSAVGWQRGRLVEISVDSETGRLNQRSSPAALLFIGVLIAIRWVLLYLVELSDARWHLGAMLVSGIFIAFAAGVLSAYRAEIFLRGRRLSRRP
ncbi:hypothetical protein ASE00_12180 [Sphingomonas sp. Root710]|uniref:CcdC protein domain-containing protein n=1 Tax=Sphingomonas sp. Root710 TaxID=1736594 RepID=UPI0006F1F12D|nr:CcdC protein domain-containing protein [Sphingomonas sp. Root710]KRB82776.1 hypothetical protein ASE00_12180 [Sphingomonas sp. Root710]